MRLLVVSVLVRETTGWINLAPPAGVRANQAAAAAEVFRVNMLLTSLPLPALNVATRPLPVDTPATIRGATASDAQRLAELCTDAFYGSHSFEDGPVIFAQRAQIYQRVEAQIRRRIAIEKGRECRLLVAATASGELCGCCDIAVHLFDRRETRFELMVDQMPDDHQRCAHWCGPRSYFHSQPTTYYSLLSTSYIIHHTGTPGGPTWPRSQCARQIVARASRGCL